MNEQQTVEAAISRLRARRTELGLTQAQVANRMGHNNRSTICNLEKGQFKPTLGVLIAWSRALDLAITFTPTTNEEQP